MQQSKILLFGKGLTNLEKKPFENITGKGENAVDQLFFLFPQCCLSYHGKIAPFKPHKDLISCFQPFPKQYLVFTCLQ